MRILPLGDSITSGEGSHDGNGYRLVLATLIQNYGNDMEYIGSLKSGNMTNNENEGHSGAEIYSVGLAGIPSYSQAPNIILLMAGTTDIIARAEVDDAPDRMATIIEEIVAACPEVVVLVGTLLPLLDPRINSKTSGFNSALTSVVWELSVQGIKVDLVDMARVSMDLIDSADGIHPTDAGYSLMAAAWYEGIIRVGEKGWIQQPVLTRPSQDQQGGNSDNEHFSPKENLDGVVINHMKTDRGSVQFLFFVMSVLGLLWIARKPLNKVGRRFVG